MPGGGTTPGSWSEATDIFPCCPQTFAAVLAGADSTSGRADIVNKCGPLPVLPGVVTAAAENFWDYQMDDAPADSSVAEQEEVLLGTVLSKIVYVLKLELCCEFAERRSRED